MNSAENILFKGFDAVKLTAGKYTAVVAYTLGSNVLRFYDETNDIEVFRYNDDVTAAEIINSPEVWGLPALYLPNRFDGGVLKTSDAVYQLPVNELRFGNHIHGFLHKRAHRIKDMGADDSSAWLVTEYEYDKNDIFYNCFPVSFRAQITVKLDSEGLHHTITLENRSEHMLPVSLATHTTYSAPFIKDGKQEDIRITVPAVKKIPFDKKRWLPRGRSIALRVSDKSYVNGTKCPVLTDICNDMYVGGECILDGKPFRGTVILDTASGKRICCETDENYKFWIVWNDRGFKNYFCIEPMTAQVNAPNLQLTRESSGYTELEPGKSYSASQRFFTC